MSGGMFDDPFAAAVTSDPRFAAAVGGDFFVDFSSNTAAMAASHQHQHQPTDGATDPVPSRRDTVDHLDAMVSHYDDDDYYDDGYDDGYGHYEQHQHHHHQPAAAAAIHQQPAAVTKASQHQPNPSAAPFVPRGTSVSHGDGGDFHVSSLAWMMTGTAAAAAASAPSSAGGSNPFAPKLPPQHLASQPQHLSPFGIPTVTVGGGAAGGGNPGTGGGGRTKVPMDATTAASSRRERRKDRDKAAAAAGNASSTSPESAQSAATAAAAAHHHAALAAQAAAAAATQQPLPALTLGPDGEPQHHLIPEGDFDEGDATKTVHIQYIPVTMTERELSDILREHGNVIRVRVCGNQRKDHNWTYGFVEYDTEAAATSLIEKDVPVRVGAFRLKSSRAKAPIADRHSSDASRANGGVCTFGLVNPSRTLKDFVKAQAKEDGNAAAAAAAAQMPSLPTGNMPTLIVGGVLGVPPVVIGVSPTGAVTQQSAPPATGSFTVTAGGPASAAPHPVPTPAPVSTVRAAPAASTEAPTVVVGSRQATTAGVFPGILSLRDDAQFLEALFSALSRGAMFTRDKNQTTFFAAMGSAMQAHDLASKALGPAMGKSTSSAAGTAAAGGAPAAGSSAASSATANNPFPQFLTGRDPVFLSKLALCALLIQHGSIKDAISYAFAILQATTQYAADTTTPPTAWSPLLLNHLMALGLLIERSCVFAARAIFNIAQLKGTAARLEVHSVLEDVLTRSLTDAQGLLVARPLSGGTQTLPTAESAFATHFLQHFGSSTTSAAFNSACVTIFSAR